jgi:hypothetical protein
VKNRFRNAPFKRNLHRYSAGLDVFVYAKPGDTNRPYARGKSVGKVVAAPTSSGVGLVLLRLKHLLPAVAVDEETQRQFDLPNRNSDATLEAKPSKPPLRPLVAVNFVAIDKESGEGRGVFKLRVDVPEWWRPEWIEDATK